MPTREGFWRPTRREFLAGSAGVAGSATAGILPAGGFFANGSDRIRVGLIGCGGRGTGAARQAAESNPAVRIVALGDLFEDHLAESARLLAADLGDRFDCLPEHRVAGGDAWQHVLDADLDAVILAATPWSRPAHLAAAVARGLHIYCERPAAVDAAGMQVAITACREAKARGLVVVSGLSTRYHAPTVETIARIHDGAIGRPVHAVCRAHLGLPWHRPLALGWSIEENRQRNWIADQTLGGGPLVERHIDAIDRSLWALGDECPVTAVPIESLGGLAVRYRFADGRTMLAQVAESACGPWAREERVTGSRGTACLLEHRIDGAAPWSHQGSALNPWKACMAGFVDAILAGGSGDGGGPLIRSTLVALLGQTAIEAGREVSWGEVATPSAGATGII